ncbi:MAG: hypothetical protein IPK05_19690 [Comamonadaceae bacterium]|nr:hypothetical protein [Comamonadaceae bacterium]
MGLKRTPPEPGAGRTGHTPKPTSSAESLNAEEIIRAAKDYLRAKADGEQALRALRAAADRLLPLSRSPNGLPQRRGVSAFAVTAPPAAP